jgi:hypothetical protein
LWTDYRDHFGVEDDPVLVWQADTKTMNPSASDIIIARKYAEDEVVARSEYGAQFRSDLEAFISTEVIDGLVIPDRRELPPMSGTRYAAFVDPSGGAADAMTLAIAHKDRDGKIVLDCVREQNAPFDPDACTAIFADTLKRYAVREVTGDYFGGEWPIARFRAFGIRYVRSEHDKSELYRRTIPILMTGGCALLDLPTVRKQFQSLERRTTKTGREVIDHPPGRHDDLVNAVCGALVAVGEIGKTKTLASIQPADVPDHSWRAPYFNRRVSQRPLPATPSDEMTRWNEEREIERERQARDAESYRKHLETLNAEARLKRFGPPAKKES